MAKAENKDTPEAAAAYAVEDIWLNAIAQLPDTTKPLADLLRTYSTPMPPSVRDLLAEYLNPGDPDICGGRLVYEPTDAIQRVVGSEVNGGAGLLSLLVDYHYEVERRKLFGEKKPSEKAAAYVGKKHKQGSARNVYRRLLAWKKIVARLRGH
jgi:hypothetical protein